MKKNLVLSVFIGVYRWPMDCPLVLRQRRIRHFSLNRRGVMEKKSEKVYRQYPVGFQKDALERMKHCDDIRALAAELGMSRGRYICGSARRKGCGHMGRVRSRQRLMSRPGRSSNWKPRWRAWKGNWGGGAWKQVFSKVPCEKSRGYGGRAKSLAEYHLRRDQRLGDARPNEYPADV